MKASDAFLKTITFVMNETDKLFSFGYYKSDLIAGPVSVILYGIGKFFKYTLGFIVSIFAGGIAYTATAFKNWFYYKNETSQQQIEPSNLQSQPSMKNQILSILTKEELVHKIERLIIKLDSKIPALKSEYEEYYQAILQIAQEKFIQEQTLPSESMSNASTIAGEITDTKNEEELIKESIQKLAPKAAQKIIELVCSAKPSGKYELAVVLENLRKKLDNLRQQINPNITQEVLSDIIKQYNFILNKVRLFLPSPTIKQHIKVVETPVYISKQYGLTADKERLFSKRAKAATQALNDNPSNSDIIKANGISN